MEISPHLRPALDLPRPRAAAHRQFDRNVATATAVSPGASPLADPRLRAARKHRRSMSPAFDRLQAVATLARRGQARGVDPRGEPLGTRDHLPTCLGVQGARRRGRRQRRRVAPRFAGTPPAAPRSAAPRCARTAPRRSVPCVFVRDRAHARASSCLNFARASCTALYSAPGVDPSWRASRSVGISPTAIASSTSRW